MRRWGYGTSRQPGSERARLAGALGLAFCLLAPACERFDLSASLGSEAFGAGGLSGQTAAALVGQWSAVVGPETLGPGLFQETTWAFAADGTAHRTVTLRTALGQVIESDETDARWRAGAGILLLEFTEPFDRIVQVSFQIEYRTDATVLILDGVRYLRVSS